MSDASPDKPTDITAAPIRDHRGRLYLAEEDVTRIAIAVERRLEAKRRVDTATHERHHECWQRWLDRQAKRSDLWDAVRKQVYGWAIVALLSAVGLVVWQWFEYVFRHKS